MKTWTIVAVLCGFGFFKEFRPSEPFISPYLNGPWKNFTEAEINQNIFPVGTYSSMILLIVVFLLTDWLRYKPVMLLQGISGLATWALLSWGQGIPIMQVVQILYGLFSATDVAYFSYMYAKIDKKYYQKSTAIVKTSLLIGKASSGFISQFLVMYCLMDYQQLNYITLAALGVATMWVLLLPPVDQSTYFHRAQPVPRLPSDYEKVSQNEGGTEDKRTDLEVQELPVKSVAEPVRPRRPRCRFLIFPTNCDFIYVLEDFVAAIKDENVVRWSIWWALSMCGFFQVTHYMQLLWQNIINEGDGEQHLYHGFSNCAHSLIGAISTYLMGYVTLKWEVYGEVALALCSLVQGCLLIYCSHNSNLILGYILYIAYRVLYQASNTIASSEIAKHLQADSYALIFGINTFMALLGQSTLTVIVIDGLKANIRTQFIIYAGYYMVTGVGFGIAAIATCLKIRRARHMGGQSTHSNT